LKKPFAFLAYVALLAAFVGVAWQFRPASQPPDPDNLK